LISSNKRLSVEKKVSIAFLNELYYHQNVFSRAQNVPEHNTKVTNTIVRLKEKKRKGTKLTNSQTNKY